MEASLAALFDSSQGTAERRRSTVQSLKRLSIQAWLATSQSGLSVCLLAVDHREFDGRDPKALREHVYFSALDRRRSSVGLVKRGSVMDFSAGDSPLLAKVLGRLLSVEASLASLTNSSDGERAAEDVEERLQAIEASLAAPKPAVEEWKRSALERIKRTSMASFVREEPCIPCLVGRCPDHFQSLESSIASWRPGCSGWCRQSGGTLGRLLSFSRRS